MEALEMSMLDDVPQMIFCRIFFIGLFCVGFSGCGQQSPTSNPIQEADEVDCNGVAGGSASTDLCGKCTGGSTGIVACVADCSGVAEGNSVEDNCGTCDDDPSNDCTQDCAGAWGGNAHLPLPLPLPH